LATITGLYTDHYQLSMAEGYFLAGRKHDRVNFDYFFRKNPFGSGFTVFAGLQVLLDSIGDFRYDADAIDFLHKRDFEDDFLDYLKNFSFQGSIYAPKEGEVVFPNEPILRIEGSIIEAQLLETLLLNTLNYQSLIATKANRLRQSAGERKLMEFGMRRAQGWAALHGSRAAVIGGADSTSNMQSAHSYDLGSSGTQAHSWVQSFEDELTAFRTFAEKRPENCVLLVDTYHTLNSGVPNAITVAKEMRQRGEQLLGIRLDSGDLAYLSKKARALLDEAGLQEVKIVASNQLDEYLIRSLIQQEAKIDIFGVGTNLITGRDDGALDGVYKLSAVNDSPKIKISEDTAKLTLPGRKQVVRYYNGNNEFYADGVLLAKEDPEEVQTLYHPHNLDKKVQVAGLKKENLTAKVFEKGKVLVEKKSIQEISDYRAQRVSRLANEYKRFENPHVYKVGLSKKLIQLRQDLVSEIREKN